MRILVLSDSHGNYYSARRALMAHSEAQVVVHCGDGARDVEDLRCEFPQRMIISVRGNCDFCTDCPDTQVINIEGKRIFITHGHNYGVKGGLYRLCCAAREQQADIVLFGHTHIPLSVYDEGLYILNPGSVGGYPGSYGLVDIEESGVVTNTATLRD